MKLLSIEFFNNPFRKMKNLKIEFGSRFTLIAGYNGIGKSTILSLISSASGLVKSQTYFQKKSFAINIDEIIHLDINELYQGKLMHPWPKLVYSTKDSNLHKRIRVTKRGTKRLRTVPSTDKDSPNKNIVGQDEKAPYPTIYLGMMRTMPIGETDENNVKSSIEPMHSDDAQCLIDITNRVISGSALNDLEEITIQSILGVKKASIHPELS